MSQRPYVEKILQRFGKEKCDNYQPDESISNPQDSFVPYQSAVGSLLYLARAMHSDIAHVFTKVARFHIESYNIRLPSRASSGTCVELLIWGCSTVRLEKDYVFIPTRTSRRLHSQIDEWIHLPNKLDCTLLDIAVALTRRTFDY